MISITIPVYNEKEAVGRLAEKVREVMQKLGQPWEVIFVNDGSQDGSAELLDKLSAKYPEVKVVHFRKNFGQTAAMMAGFDFASGDIIIPMDGDYQNDPEDIPRMLDKLAEGYDVCSGWRRDRQDDTVRRNIPSIMANRLISWVSGVRLHDFGCSLKAYRAEVIKGVRLYGEMHRFLPIYSSWHGAKITELPVNHFARTTGSSKYGLERVIKVLFDLVTVKFLDKFQMKPMYLFGTCGVISLAMGGVSFLWMALLYFLWDKPLSTTPLPLLVVFGTMIGVVCLLMGLLAEMITRTFYESQGKTIYLIKNLKNLQAPSVRSDLGN
ncbi:MAG: glycosyltransferase family 2 protein [Chthoniobacterales bacterium]